MRRRLLVRTFVLLGVVVFGGGADSACPGLTDPTDQQAATVLGACRSINWAYCSANYPRTLETCCPPEQRYLNPCFASTFTQAVGNVQIAGAACSTNTSTAISDYGQCNSVVLCSF